MVASQINALNQQEQQKIKQRLVSKGNLAKDNLGLGQQRKLLNRQ
jgi:hypothetical protein